MGGRGGSSSIGKGRYKVNKASGGFFGDLKAENLQIGDVMPRQFTKKVSLTIDKGTPYEFKKKISGGAEVKITNVKKTAKLTKITGYYETTTNTNNSIKIKHSVNVTFKSNEDVQIRLK